ncbi:MAG: arginine--tRNA ligase [Rikenellaceae bacterium]
MIIENFISEIALKAVTELYAEVEPKLIQVSPTRKEFVGDYTLVTFPLTRISGKKPEDCGIEIGEKIVNENRYFESYNIIKGFLNLKLSDEFWIERFAEISQNPKFGYKESNGHNIMVEYSSPNTNKPLHLGHIRNNLLGYSVSKILEANGNSVKMVNLVNDRGIHICKSMTAWILFGNNETPATTGMKGDHLVGKYYVLFDQAYKKQIAELIEGGMDKDSAAKNAEIMVMASEMLRKWEAKDSYIYDLWKTMNGWVYEGFDKTYKALGVSFDKVYYESDTYLLGKSLVEDGLSREVFYRREDSSVWIDLTEDGLDEKLLLRGDGTSVYMTQDLGTALERHNEFGFDKMTYVVGNEQNYHFQVLKLILKKLGYEWADNIYHLSYGMVELPEGKMKSREGTVVDADDLIEGMIETAREMSQELGKLDSLTSEEADEIVATIGTGALKYFILKVDPRKTMLFDPKESIDFNGNTAPFIQYTHARIKSVLRRATEQGIVFDGNIEVSSTLAPKEIEVIKRLYDFQRTLTEAGDNMSPSIIAAYCYETAKEFNQYYHDFSFLKEENAEVRANRLRIAQQSAKIISNAMSLLGISVPDRM